MKTREDLLQYAKSVHEAIHGNPIPKPSSYTSDHPYDGYDMDIMSDLIDPKILKKQVREFKKDLQVEVERQVANLEIGAPVKITKGSKDKRGVEGFILHAQEPMQGSGKALFVYDVLTNNNCMVRSTAIKPRLPKEGERDLLKETYQVCIGRKGSFTQGKRVELKDGTRQGHCMNDAQLDPNLEGNGFYQVKVQWDGYTAPSQGVYILTELNLI
jgi:hypothetical protein